MLHAITLHFLNQITVYANKTVTIALQGIFCLILKVQHPEEKGSGGLVTVIVLPSAD